LDILKSSHLVLTKILAIIIIIHYVFFSKILIVQVIDITRYVIGPKIHVKTMFFIL
jgi:hypothetical protein